METNEANVLKIIVVENGFIVSDNDGKLSQVFEERENDELYAIEALLWHILNALGPSGREFSREKISIVRETGDEYTALAGE